MEPPRSSIPDNLVRPGLRRRRRRWLVLAALLVAGGVAAALAVLLTRGPSKPGPLYLPRPTAQASDPLSYTAAQRNALEQAAAQGYAQVLYLKSPGGVVAAARRTARYRKLVERATAGTAIDPNLLEAIVFLESAGRPDVIAGNDPASAAGLTQILAETAKDFLGMHVDLAQSRILTGAIVAAKARHDAKAVKRLEARRRRIDARFVPAQALAGTVRYLLTARKRFGRSDLAVVSYHMGIGNLSNVVHDYAGPGAVKALVAADELSWARLYFGCTPIDHRSAWVRIAGFGDDSQTYYWRVLAAERIMHLYRTDPVRLKELAALHRAAPSAEDALHPPATTESFTDPHDLEQAWHRGIVQPLPQLPVAFHLRVSPQMGVLAATLNARRGLYRGLQPDALALLLYLAGRVHAYSSAPALIVATTVLDETYRRQLPASDPHAGTGYSPLTTGWSFDIRRRYDSQAQAAAFQYELERLQARNLIAWERYPDTIHVTVSTAASALVPAMLRLAPAAARP